ncbi:MAG TPA: TauD/TfdA family dioxygenase, partial [Novosphingobium sp.]|nr:TauD/TfdA family dioxygenase [Novosphingobium sp.]
MFEVIARKPFSAEIRGLDLKRPDPAMAPELQALLAKHRVLVFRDVLLSPEEQVNFISLFGRVVAEVVGEQALNDPKKLFGKVSYVTSKPDEYISGTNAIVFHSDWAFYADGPARAISLHGLEIGAEDPTIFADMIAGTRLLPPALLEQLRTLETVQCNNYPLDAEVPFRMSRRVRGADYCNTAAIRPAIIRHPVTGEEIVNLSQE